METREFLKGGDDKSKRIDSIVIVPRKRDATKLLKRHCYPAWNVFNQPNPLGIGQDASTLTPNHILMNSPFLESSTFAAYCGFANGFIAFYAGTIDTPDDAFASPATVTNLEDALQNQPQNKVTLQMVTQRASMRDGSNSSSPQIAAEWRLSPPRLISLSDGHVNVFHGESLDPVEGYFDVPSVSQNVQLMAHAKSGDTPLLALLSKKQINILVLTENRAAVQPSSSGQPLIINDTVTQLDLTTYTLIVGTKREITVYCVRTNQPLDTLSLEKNVPLQIRSNIHGTVLIRQTMNTILALSVGDGRDVSFEKARKFEIPNLGPGPQNRGEDQIMDFTISDPFFTIYTQTGKVMMKSLYSGVPEDHPHYNQEMNLLVKSSTTTPNQPSAFDMQPIQAGDGKWIASYGSLAVCISTSNDIQVVSQSTAAMQAYSLIGIGAIGRAVPHFICASGPLDHMTQEEEERVEETVEALHYAAAKRACRTGQHAEAWGHFREGKCTVQQVLAEVPMLTETEKSPSSGLLGGAPQLVDLLLFLLRRAQREDDDEDIRAINWALLIILTSEVAIYPPLKTQEREQFLTDLLAPPGRGLPALAAAQQRLDAAEKLISPECLTTCRTFLLFANEEAHEALEVCRERKSVGDAGLCLSAVIEQYGGGSGGDPADLAELLSQQLPWMVAADAKKACAALRNVKRTVVWEGAVVEAVCRSFIGYPLERCKMLQYFVSEATLHHSSVSFELLHTSYASALILVVKCLKLMSGTGSHTVDVAPGSETGLLGKWRQELLRHLRNSNYYDTDMALMELNTAVDAHSFVGLATKTDDLPLRFRVLRFYAKYNPDKIDSVDDSLAGLKGSSDEEIMNKLISKYGDEPELDDEVMLDMAEAAVSGKLGDLLQLSNAANIQNKSRNAFGIPNVNSRGENLHQEGQQTKSSESGTSTPSTTSTTQQQQQQNSTPGKNLSHALANNQSLAVDSSTLPAQVKPRAPPAPALYHETAIVHSKRNDDGAALHTLLYEMNDVDAALIFCLETTGIDSSDDPNNNNNNGSNNLRNKNNSDAIYFDNMLNLGSPASPTSVSGGNYDHHQYSSQFSDGTASPLGRMDSLTGHAISNFDHESANLISPIGRGGTSHAQHLATAGSPDVEDLVHGGRNTTTTRSGRMLTLLVQKLLRPPPGFERKLEEAVAILSRHAESLDAEAVLSVVPADVPFTRFAPYLSRHFEQSSHNKHQLTLQAQVLSSEHFRLQQQLYRLQNRAVLVDEERTCSVCGKRLGDVMVVVYPNMRVVHFRCAKDRSRDPVAQVPFFQTVM